MPGNPLGPGAFAFGAMCTDYRRLPAIPQTNCKPFSRLARRLPSRRGSVAVGTAARQDAQDDDHALLVVEGEPDPPVADSQAPLECAQLANVGRERILNEAIERIDDASANGRVKPPKIATRRRRHRVRPWLCQARPRSRLSSSDEAA